MQEEVQEKEVVVEVVEEALECVPRCDDRPRTHYYSTMLSVPIGRAACSAPRMYCGLGRLVSILVCRSDTAAAAAAAGASAWRELKLQLGLLCRSIMRWRHLVPSLG